MATSVLPTSSSGLYHLAMPERICRSVPVPSSRMNFSSLSDLRTFSQLFTFTARKSDLQKVSKSTCSPIKGSTSRAGRAAFWASSMMASNSLSSFAISMRGNKFSPLETGTLAGSTPHCAALSQPRASPPAPIWAKILSQLAGMKGVSSTAQMRTVSSRL